MVAMTLSRMMQDKVLVLDGAMGTQIFARNPTVDDYGGAALEGCVELLNVNRRRWIQDIHESYFQAGADAVETNSFGCNELVLGDFDIGHRTHELNVAAAQLAREVAQSFQTPKFVVGSVGPGTKILTLLQVDYATLYRSYFAQMKGLLEGGVDAILIETSQDLGQIKLAMRAARNAMKEMRIQRPVWVQVTVETTGTLLVGSDIQAALTSVEMLAPDVFGMNCATGPDEMRPHMAYLSEAASMALSCLPNAGLPRNEGGQTVYPLGPEGFADKVTGMAREFGLGVVGGCCGTSPEHIAALASRAQSLTPRRPKGRLERSVASLYTSVPLDLEPRPLYVGERTNANGSKKFRDLLGAEDWDGLVSVARSQLKEGAHVLDVCVAYVGRNETRDMEEFLKRAVTQVNIPLMIDSTEVPVIERALQLAPGKCIVNSINFEDGDERARTILGLCKEYGAAVVALTIDETGMAKTLAHKQKIVQRLVAMAVDEFGMAPGDLIIDPLTFTLGSGDEEFRASAVATLDGIRYVKEAHPGVRTILGLSNVSFGLSPYPRQILNSVMLYEAVKAGLDMAILNASKIVPMASLDADVRALFEDLLFDRRGWIGEGATREVVRDPLKEILARFADSKGSVQGNASERAAKRAALPVEERLKIDIIEGEKQQIVADALEALKTHPPLSIINDILLAGMKVVGDRFGAGEMQLPFVLESAEAMKTAVRTLEPFMERKEGYTKGCMLLATVKGDVHDIGKNLVEIILSNNGYSVVNMGIKQPVESILEKLHEVGQNTVDCIGLSGLLVKSTVIMKDNLEYMAGRGFTLPVVLGGAALTRKFVEEDCQAVYPGPVFYAGDAFEGLKLMERIAVAKELGTPLDVAAVRAFSRASNAAGTAGGANAESEASGAAPNGDSAPKKGITVVRRGEARVALDARGQSEWVRKSETVPEPPFFGTRVLADPIGDVFDMLDEFALVRSRWGFQKGNIDDVELERTLHEKAYPALAHWRERVTKEKLLIPQAVYGYFPACSEGDSILVYAPGTKASQDPRAREIIARFPLPRQTGSRRLCISDFFRHAESGELDVLGVQVVTMGEGATAFAQGLYAEGRFSEYFLFHGLGTELTEAYAEKVHKRIRTELGIVGRDAPTLRQIFSQGYQGSRYSFGYPACPDMELNEPLLKLLDAERIGVVLSESHQMVPEQSTSALVAWHPQARYFST